MKTYRSDDRMVGFRVNNEFVNYLVYLGKIPADWDTALDKSEKRKVLGAAVQDFLLDAATQNMPTAEVTTSDVPDLLKVLQSIDARLDQLEGKHQPQVA